MRVLTILMVLMVMSSCISKNQDAITHIDDYQKYLTSKAVNTSSKYFELWNSKIRSDSMQLTSFGVVGGEYNRYFKETGDIQFLKKAEQSLERAVAIAAIGRPAYYRALARNYISQHRFREALQMADSASAIGGGKTDTQSLYFDLHMELGNYEMANKYLDSIKNMSSFGYLIRLAKWNDYKGDLDTTINFMEKAKLKAEDAKNKELMLWSYTNLADYYGHAGRIEDSYQHYLKALALDGQNAYSKKGIAWIVFANDKKPEEAIRILDSVTKYYDAPDYYLLKAEIADYMGNEDIRTKNLDEYFKRVADSAYGDMYNAYNLDLYIEETKQYDSALALAKQEVANRPTPESYSWLAYALFKNGENKKALEIVENHVYGKTFEPALLYRSAAIFKANGQEQKLKELKGELIGAFYELGPSMEKRILDL